MMLVCLLLLHLSACSLCSLHYPLVTSHTDPHLRERGVYVHKTHAEGPFATHEKISISQAEWLWLHFAPVSYPSLKFAIELIFNFNNIIILIMKDTAVPFKSSPV